MKLDDADSVGILAGHLRELINVIDFAYSDSLAQDIQRQARTLDKRDKRQSQLTTALERQLQRFESYLNEAEAEPEYAEDDDE